MKIYLEMSSVKLQAILSRCVYVCVCVVYMCVCVWRGVGWGGGGGRVGGLNVSLDIIMIWSMNNEYHFPLCYGGWEARTSPKCF